MKRITLILSLGCVGLWLLAACANTAFSLAAYSFANGTNTYEFSAVQNGTIHFPTSEAATDEATTPQSMPIQMEFSGLIDLTIEEKGDNIVQSVTYRDLKITSDQLGSQELNESDLEGMGLGKQEMEFNSKGELVSLNGKDPGIEVSGAISNSSDLCPVLPDEKVEDGSTWKSDIALPLTGKIEEFTSSNAFKMLSGEKGKVGEVTGEYSGPIDIKLNLRKTMEALGLDASVDLSLMPDIDITAKGDMEASQTCEIDFDKKTLVSQETKTDMDFVYSVPNPESADSPEAAAVIASLDGMRLEQKMDISLKLK